MTVTPNEPSNEGLGNENLTATAIDGLSIHSGSLSVDCYQTNDRVGHRVFRGSDLVLISLEDNTDQEWPISPPFQQIVSEPLGADKKPVLLGVGMAGKSHWSAAIESDSFGEAIAFDMACRVVKVPGFLGSTYKINEGWQATLVRSHQIDFTKQSTGDTFCLTGIGRLAMNLDQNRLVITCEIDEALHTRGKTYRWRYAISPERLP